MSVPSEHDQAAAGPGALATAVLINVGVTAVEGTAGIFRSSDAGASAAVVAGGALMWHWLRGVDAIPPLGIGLLTVKAALRVLRFAIAHATFQLETSPCHDTGLLADPRVMGSRQT